MKISHYKFLQILAKHLLKKAISIEPSVNDLNMTANALMPMFVSLAGSLKAKKILDPDNKIDINILEKEVNAFFKLIPIFNLPVGDTAIKITKKDLDPFIKELFQSGEVEEVIYLSCQS